MKVFRSPRALKAAVQRLQATGRTIGFVPTMGFLHEGHLSLVRRARRENGAVIVSIFVNPLQFGPKEDFKRYPRNLARDARLLRRVKTDVLFVPDVGTFYPKGFQTIVSVGAYGHKPLLNSSLCGKRRPIHFSGVATVVLKLLNIVSPDTLYLGQKDFQQCRVIEQMARDLDLAVNIRRVATVREADGLAMSSRNVYLSPEERGQAPFLFRSLKEGRALIRRGARSASEVKKAMQKTLSEAPSARLDYLEIVDAATLEPVVKLKARSQVLLALAVFFGKTRLIDNLLVTV